MVLAVAGDLVEDVVVRALEPVRFGSDARSVITRQRGGSAANVATFAAAAGARVRFVGCVGDDPAGDGVAADLARAGVDVRVQRRGSTGTIVVVVDEAGERTMFPSRGASAELVTVDDDCLDDVEVLHLPLYGFDDGSTPDALRDMAARVRTRGGRLSVDVSSTRLVDVHGVAWVRGLLDELAPTWVSANADEVVALALDDPAWWDAHPSTTVVARAGARPTRVLRAGHEPLVVPVEAVPDVADTTGAGDAFAAGFLTATLAGRDIRDAVAAGHALAGRAIRSAGATLS